jgi:DNA topoisomerase-1
MELIVTEKENAARRIAEILSDGAASTEEVRGVTVYRWGETRCVGLSGHVVEVDFPPEYDRWRDVEPRELVDAPVVTRPSRERFVNAVQALAEDADRVTIATDYDREGELIGKEALDLIREVTDAPARRVRFSSLTGPAVTEAFAEPDELDRDLAAAGEARQIVDLVWGAALTRFLSLTAGRTGDDFVSVGRVQSPTLRLLVDREREIRAFEPDDYWEVFADLADDEPFEAQYVYDDEDGTQADRLWDGDRADAVLADLRHAGDATVASVERRERTDSPPAPFATTAFIRAAGSLGYGANRAMSIAEDLYTAGYVTYPRTDNTVYPEDLDERDLVERLVDPFEEAEELLDGDLVPTEGDEETTDHPPIHPTGDVPDPGDLSDDEWQVYELIARRFLATVADPARWAHLRIDAEVPADAAPGEGGVHRLRANGKRLLEPGYHAVYPYFSADETHLPELDEGQSLRIVEARSEAKQTQPPRRFGQSRLVERMEDLGIGTKATRHNIVEKLYDRGYVEGDPPRPTALAMAVVDAAEEYASAIVDEQMTAELEAEMDAVANGEKSLDEVAADSRELLGTAFRELTDSREAIGDHIRRGLKDDRTLGPCPESDHQLVLREARDGSRFVGCDGYPDCDYTLTLPDEGAPHLLDERCDEHDLRDVKLIAGRNTRVHGCPQCVVDAAGPVLELDDGSCPTCGDAAGGTLVIRRTENGNRLVGCTRYPECDFSTPFPRDGEVRESGERCDAHDLPELEIGDPDDEPWAFGCPICNYLEFADLEELDGVGETTAERLADAGVDSLGALADANPDDLAAEVDGVSADRVREWQASVA